MNTPECLLTKLGHDTFLSFMDAEDYSNQRNEYARWFNDRRKKLMKAFEEEGQRLDPSPPLPQ